MKKRIIWTALAIICAGQTAAQDSLGAPRLAPTADQAQTAYLSAQILGRYHYKSVPLDDAMSEKIFDRYLKALDPERLFFTQADVDSFADARTRLDDAILKGNLSAPFTIFQRFEQRVTERLTDARELLARDFDFSVKEGYPYARDKAPWPKDDAEVRDLWRKRVKNDWLRLKLAGKDDKAIRETLGKRYDNYLARATRNKSEDVFQVFMNAYMMTGGGPDNATTMIGLLIYNNAFTYNKYGLACAQAVILTIIIAAISFLQFKMAGSDVEY